MSKPKRLSSGSYLADNIPRWRDETVKLKADILVVVQDNALRRPPEGYATDIQGYWALEKQHQNSSVTMIDLRNPLEHLRDVPALIGHSFKGLFTLRS